MWRPARRAAGPSSEQIYFRAASWLRGRARKCKLGVCSTHPLSILSTPANMISFRDTSPGPSSSRTVTNPPRSLSLSHSTSRRSSQSTPTSPAPHSASFFTSNHQLQPTITEERRSSMPSLPAPVALLSRMRRVSSSDSESDHSDRDVSSPGSYSRRDSSPSRPAFSTVASFSNLKDWSAGATDKLAKLLTPEEPITAATTAKPSYRPVSHAFSLICEGKA